MSLETCLDAIDALKKRRTLLENPTWIPSDLVEILLLLPRRARDQDFRDLVFVLDCVKTACSLYKNKDWLPGPVDVERMLRISTTHEALPTQ